MAPACCALATRHLPDRWPAPPRRSPSRKPNQRADARYGVNFATTRRVALTAKGEHHDQRCRRCRRAVIKAFRRRGDDGGRRTDMIVARTVCHAGQRGRRCRTAGVADLLPV